MVDILQSYASEGTSYVSNVADVFVCVNLSGNFDWPSLSGHKSVT